MQGLVVLLQAEEWYCLFLHPQVNNIWKACAQEVRWRSYGLLWILYCPFVVTTMCNTGNISLASAFLYGSRIEFRRHYFIAWKSGSEALAVVPRSTWILVIVTSPDAVALCCDLFYRLWFSVIMPCRTLCNLQVYVAYLMAKHFPPTCSSFLIY